MQYIRFFSQITIADVPLVGGKNASLGQMYRDAQALGIRVPDGYALTAQAYRRHIELYGIQSFIDNQVAHLDFTNPEAVQAASQNIRAEIEAHPLPDDIAQELCAAYDQLSHTYGRADVDVAVRSSATAEDLPGASFAGQQETFLHVVGHDQLVRTCIKAFSSLYTPRAMVYRREKGFPDSSVALSVGVQKMVRSDRGAAGVLFTLDTESGSRTVVTLNAAYGLGEYVVQGIVTPDEYVVAKKPLAQGFQSIVKKTYGSRDRQLVYTDTGGTQDATMSPKQKQTFVLQDAHILELARAGVALEQFYTAVYKTDTPLDIEWALDGEDGQAYIVQARPETVHALGDATSSTFTVYRLTEKATPLCTGISIGTAIVSGRVIVIESPTQAHLVQQGDILVTHMTDPDWVPIMKRAAAIVTNSGGRTCHAAIVSRELGIPALVGTTDATHVLTSGDTVTVDTSQGMQGYVYAGQVPYVVDTVQVDTSAHLPLLVNLAQPDRAFEAARLPVGGVGLLRMEFVLGSTIGIHPLACTQYEQLEQPLQDAIAERCMPYTDPRTFFVETLARAIALIATAFEDRRVIVRLSDFKTNEYRQLLGGELFEAVEENPMLGARGAYRYLQEWFAPAFALECAALRMVRDVLGMRNITIMVPFVRTPAELKAVRDLLIAENVLSKDGEHTPLYMMVEIPTNVVLLDAYAPYVQGFSIGSNDLTQLTLGVDRDSGVLSAVYSERDEAVKALISQAIDKARAHGLPIGICGQAPSDDYAFAQWLLERGITTISLNPDSVLPLYQTFHTTTHES